MRPHGSAAFTSAPASARSSTEARREREARVVRAGSHSSLKRPSVAKTDGVDEEGACLQQGLWRLRDGSTRMKRLLRPLALAVSCTALRQHRRDDVY
jgi:hypothetical protein